ncbi:hypothetical protein SDRG_01054 [Saprolegnia diclina VS20]|uniref:Uncharacterized protein n=1 Tax=Saprolegnia diclina (strain VS20) TaxID=1156394 RepID=T0R5K0_SAPDV|nr:hypothetical protein SDRG_01054 [Saprolegnia diclina VS20]EQC42216.1 hypothetical protein SDRG_01054 [Saprolegnia diclina VS20]|eukprot:XP_008604785.1 hypothetical protein SDRG_01054 [Saprolegnia diclina VS20]
MLMTQRRLAQLGRRALGWRAASTHAATQRTSSYLRLVTQTAVVTAAAVSAITAAGLFTPEPSPLTTAAANGDVAEVATLLAAGVSPNATTGRGGAPLLAAVKRGSEDCVRVLLDAGADPHATHDGVSMTMLAMLLGHVPIVALLVAADPSVMTQTSRSSAANMTPFELAVHQDRPDLVSLFLGAGADANTSIRNSIPILVYAASRGVQPSVLALLIDAGANVDAVALPSGRSALYCAARNNNEALVDVLLAADATVDMCSSDGDTSLAIAAWYGHNGVVTRLIAASADVNHCCTAGISPLYDAALRRHPDVVATLLEAGADVHKCTQAGESVLSAAVTSGHAGVLALVQDALQR